MNIEDNKRKEELFNMGIEAFNSSNYYDAHEYWEDLWSDYRLVDAKFVQALIQLSVGYFHITNNNKNGALGLLNKCKPKFELYLPSCRGIDIENILKLVDKSIENINKINKMTEFDWSLVPRIEI